MKLYGPLVYGVARRRGLSAQDAADVMQEVFVSVWRGIQAFSLDRPDATFRGWLRTITRNAVNQHLRRMAGQPTITSQGLDLADAQQATSPDEDGADVSTDELYSDLTQRALELVRDSVDATTWDAFWKTAVSEQPVDNVAEQLQMSAAAVRQAKYRVLCRLRDLLSDH